MEDGTYALAATDWVGTPVAVPLEHDRRAVVSLDHRTEVRTKRSVIPPSRIVRTTETPADASFTAAFGQREMLLPLPADTDPPLLRIGEADPIQSLQPHSHILAASAGRPTQPPWTVVQVSRAPPAKSSGDISQPIPLTRLRADLHGS